MNTTREYMSISCEDDLEKAQAALVREHQQNDFLERQMQRARFENLQLREEARAHESYKKSILSHPAIIKTHDSNPKR